MIWTIRGMDQENSVPVINIAELVVEILKSNERTG
jgi:hypothetical protein